MLTTTTPQVIPLLDSAIEEIYRAQHGVPRGVIVTRPFNVERERAMRDLNPEGEGRDLLWGWW